jgi:Asp/Glu/hydantoin racemase
LNLLVVNPNTSASVTETLRRHVHAAVGDAVTLYAVTARFGASYIASEASFAIAGHATLDAYAAHAAAYGEPDSVLVGCFGDPGVEALRELSSRPVIGLAEAAMRAAAARGRYAIVTGGAAWGPILWRLARALDLAATLVEIRTVAPSGGALAADPDAAHELLRDACHRASSGVASVILGGAGLAGMAAQVGSTLTVPLIDSVHAGALAALAAVGQRTQPTLPLAPPAGGTWTGISPTLLQHLQAVLPEDRPADGPH